MVTGATGSPGPTRADLSCETPHCPSTSPVRIVLVFTGQDADTGPSRARMCQTCEKIATEAGAVVARLSKRYAQAELDAMCQTFDQQALLWPTGF